MPKTFAENQAYRDAFLRDYDNDHGGHRIPMVVASQVMTQVDPYLIGNLYNNNSLPEDLDITEQYPGVDPMGMFCDVDMGFMQRLNQVKIAAAFCPLEHQASIGRIFTKLGDPNSDLHNEFLMPMRRTAEDIRRHDRTQRMAPNEEIWNQLARTNYRNSDTITHFDEMVNNMEYMVGLRDALPPASSKLERATGLSQETMNTLHQSSNEINARPNLNIPFPDMKNILAQRYLAHPDNGRKTIADAPTDYRTPAVAEKAVSAAVTGAAKYSLDAMYKKTEGRQPSSNHPDLPNRGTLIAIDGKTVAQRMAEEYKAADKPPSQYNQWYKDNVATKSAEYVSAGLMAGKRVESFLPDKEGKLPDTPTVITKTGVEPTPLQPVTLNAWERFFSKRGYYKEKVAQKADYDRIMEGRKAVAETMKDAAVKQETVANRESMAKRFEEASVSRGDSMRDTFIGHHLIDGNTPPTTGELGLGRSNVTTACICKMAADGHPFEDILDPNKLQDEKKAVGDYYVAVATGKTPPTLSTGEGGPSETPDKGAENIGKWIYDGQKAILNRIDTEMSGLDYHRLEDHPSYSTWSNMITAGFDASQNKSSSFLSTQKGYLDAAEADFQSSPALRQKMEERNPALRGIDSGKALTQAQRLECAKHFDEPLNASAQIINAYNDCLDVASAPVNHNTLKTPVVKAVLADRLNQQSQLQQQATPNTPAPFSQLMSMNEMLQLPVLTASAVLNCPHTRSICKASPEALRQVNHAFSAGTLSDTFRGIDPNNLQSSLNNKMGTLRNTVSAAAREHTAQANAPTQEARQAPTQEASRTAPQARSPRR